MKIGVVSDTHSHLLPKKMLDDFKAVDCVIHAGDFCSVQDLKVFQKLKEVYAVFGNMDGLELRQILPEREILEIGGIKIGLYHGHGSPEKVFDIVKMEFRKEEVDVVIFGHSHYPVNEVVGKVLYFNPGSPTDVIRAPYRSYGMLDIEDGKVSGKIINVED